MRILLDSKWLLLFLVFSTCYLVTQGRRGGGGSRGGGSRGGSRGSSSRGSSSRGSTASRTPIDRNRDRGRDSGHNNPPAPAPQPAPKPQPKPSAPAESTVNRQQPAQNPNYRESNQGAGANQQPPPYAPRERPPPYSPSAPQAPPGGGVGGGVPGANYPRQPGFPNNPQSGGVPPPAYPGGVQSGNYPRQPGVNPGGVAPPAYPGGVQSGNYPRQPGVNPGGVAPPAYPGGVQSGNYPRQPGVNPGGVAPPAYPGGVQSGNYPRQPGVGGGGYPQQGGIAGANYPRQPNYPPQTLGSNVWRPQSGMPSPAYMNHGGIPTGANMYSKPLKQKGFLGSLMTMGGSKSHKNKYYGSQPSPYASRGRGGMIGGLAGGMALGGAAGYLAGRSAAMYTILPFMVMRSATGMYSPYHHYGGYGYYGHGYGHGHYGQTHYDVYNNDYVGRCNRPITPDHGKVICNSTRKEVDCDVTCEEGYRFSDNTTSKMNKCWHVTGIWKPTKNFEACEPVCNQTCLNGGKCASPGVCGCSSEYRGPHCEFHFLNCDIRKLANGMKIRWVCTHTKNETSCKVKCKDPLEFATPSESLYKCTPEGVWTPSSMTQCVMPGSEGQDATKSPEENVTKSPDDSVTKVPSAESVTEDTKDNLESG